MTRLLRLMRRLAARREWVDENTAMVIVLIVIGVAAIGRVIGAL